MKQIWPTYAYSPTTNVLTLTGLNIDRDQLLLVTAADRGRIMYNFADSSVTASAFTSGANTALTLVATTAGLTTTAALVIYYDDQLQSTSVSISNFPSTQTISGTVTANLGNAVGFAPGDPPDQAVRIAWTSDDTLRGAGLDAGGEPLPIQIYLGNSVGNRVTTGNPLPISGTVTIGSALPAGTNRIGVVTIGAGTVTIGAGTAQIGSVTASISNSVTIASLPAISGTVTANSSNGSLTTRFGSVTTANTAFETSAVTNGSRKYLLIQNITTASNVITVGIGFTPTTTQGIQLFAGAGLTFEGSYIPTGAVNLLSSVTASCYTILEA